MERDFYACLNSEDVMFLKLVLVSAIATFTIPAASSLDKADVLFEGKGLHRKET